MQVGNRLLAIIVLLACFFAGSFDVGAEIMKLKIPYQPDTGQCYERLAQSNQEFKNGFESLKTIAASSDAFADRLDKILKSNEEISRKGKALSPQQPWREENAYVCCVYDLLESVFAAEEESILNNPAENKEKQNKLNQLLKALKKVDFGSPQWNGRIKPRIEEELKQNLAKVR
jgi:hypothetical protein